MSDYLPPQQAIFHVNHKSKPTLTLQIVINGVSERADFSELVNKTKTALLNSGFKLG